MSAQTSATEPLLSVRDLVQEFVVRGAGGARGGVVQAVSGVSFDIMPGETLGIVGETGSGKSTLARAVLQAPRPKSGSVVFRGADLTELRGGKLLQARRHMQFVWQDPFGSLDPKWKVRSIVEEPLVAYRDGDRAARRKRVDELLNLVGLDPERYAGRHPRELSGGQAQRVAIARAVALNPSLLICDEAVSSLDVLIQAQVLNLFERLRRELGLSYLFIAHDLALVKQVSDRVGVMYLGMFCEVGPGRAGLQAAAAPVHEGAARLHPVHRAWRGARLRHHQGRAAVPDRPAVRLPVPHPLPPRHRPVRAGGAAAPGARARAPGGLPPPAHRAGPGAGGGEHRPGAGLGKEVNRSRF